MQESIIKAKHKVGENIVEATFSVVNNFDDLGIDINTLFDEWAEKQTVSSFTEDNLCRSLTKESNKAIVFPSSYIREVLSESQLLEQLKD